MKNVRLAQLVLVAAAIGLCIATIMWEISA